MDILDCDWKFKFQCPQRWNQLKEGDDQTFRYCETCQRNVYLCTTHQAVGEHASQGHCVVIMIPKEPGSDDFDQFGMGEICDDCDHEAIGRHSQRGHLPRSRFYWWIAAGLITVAFALCAGFRWL
jgi:hypothetical protein